MWWFLDTISTIKVSLCIGRYEVREVIHTLWFLFKLCKTFAVDKAAVLSTSPISDHTQCKFRPVYNNSQQDQCDTVWSTTRRNIHCGDHPMLWQHTAVQTNRAKEIYFQLVFLLKKFTNYKLFMHTSCYVVVPSNYFIYKLYQVLNLLTASQLQLTSCPTVKNYVSWYVVKTCICITITATHTLVINASIETTTKSLMPTLSYETCCPKLQCKCISVNCEFVYQCIHWALQLRNILIVIM